MIGAAVWTYIVGMAPVIPAVLVAVGIAALIPADYYPEEEE